MGEGSGGNGGGNWECGTPLSTPSETPVLALKINKKGVGAYLGPPLYGYALNCHLVYFAIPGTHSLCMKRQNLLVFFICNRKK